MILLIDRGNTRLKWRVVSGEQVLGEEHDDDSLSYLHRAAATFGYSFERILIACVAGEAVALDIRSSLKDLLSRTCDVIDVQTLSEFLGLKVAYSNVREMGVDRWLQLVAVHSEQVSPALVVSLGTAITVDKLSVKGRHVGGLIAPGWDMLRSVVQSSTALIGTTLPAAPKFEGLGASTERCLYGGVSLMLSSFMAAVDDQFGGDCAVKIIAGGGSEMYSEELGYERRHALVLDGLFVVVQHLSAYFEELKHFSGSPDR